MHTSSSEYETTQLASIKREEEKNKASKMIARLLPRHGAVVIALVLFVIQAPSPTSIHAKAISGGACIASEREALIAFRQSFLDPTGRLSSWRGLNCCRWMGVRCSNRTSHVIKLDLRGGQNFSVLYLRGELSSSLSGLHHLRYLDLSLNDFNDSRIPLFLGTLSNLRYLNLSQSWFQGIVPSQLGNLSRLEHLDLNSFGFYYLEVLDLSWLPMLSLLKSLYLSGLDLSSDWVHKVNMLPNLKIISLSGCGLNSTISNLSHSNLTNLEILDLSFNLFNSSFQHNWFWSLTTIKELFLTQSEWYGSIPDALGNMSSLEVIYLDGNFLSGIMPAALKSLCNLQLLDLTFNNINGGDMMRRLPQCSWSKLRKLNLPDSGLTGELPVWIGNLTNLSYLDLSDNMLVGSVPSGIRDMRSLSYLDLSYNMLVGSIPSGIENMRSALINMDLSQNMPVGSVHSGLGNLRPVLYLDLHGNMLDGSLPSVIGNMSSLTYLDLSQNKLVGSVPFGVGNMRKLEYLDLSQNMLVGKVPDGIGTLSHLTYLSLGLNNFSSVLSKEHFANLVNLEYLNLSQNSLKIDFDEHWVPPFKLMEAHLRSCDMGPLFPTWLRWQTGIRTLDISNTRINDGLPHWFWVVFSNASSLDLSENKLSGVLPAKLELPFIEDMDLSGNSLSGQLPANLTAPSLRSLLIHNNQFIGTIPEYVCYVLSEINLSNNQLSGDFSQCLATGSAIGSSLFMVDLKNNNFSGEFPQFLQSATELSFLDLSHNKFSGIVPTWIAAKMPRLEVLILQSNMFQGHLPEQLTELVGLHYLDVAFNNISGSLPSSLARLRAMRISKGGDAHNYSSDSISTFVKDRELNYTHELTKQIVLIDFSSNAFTGYIPAETFFLKGLRSLNLSSNQLSGAIPSNISALRGLESLDLSYNFFTGEIPSSLSDLNFLSCLNLSYNDLSGKIPTGQQLQTLNNQYMYIGNPGLCGPPLLNNCSTNETNQDGNQVNGGEVHDILSLYLSLSTGFMVGLWTVFCTMLFRKTWRIAFFRLFDMLYGKFYVEVAIRKAAIVRKFQAVES